MKRLTQKLRSVFAARVTVLKGGFCAAFFMATGFFTLQSNLAYAQPCNDVGGRVVSMEGAFTVAGNLTQMGEAICSGDEIMVGQGSRGAIRLASSQTVVRVNQNSSFVIEASGTDGSLLKLFKGVLYLFSRQPESLRVDTPYVNAAIDGTEFVVAASDTRSEVTVIEGHVFINNAHGEIRLVAGELVDMDRELAAGLNRHVHRPVLSVKLRGHQPQLEINPSA